MGRIKEGLETFVDDEGAMFEAAYEGIADALGWVRRTADLVKIAWMESSQPETSAFEDSQTAAYYADRHLRLAA